ncbi:MAG: DUF4105 domain-containing protein [Prolixibacteraceae bacterium]
MRKIFLFTLTIIALSLHGFSQPLSPSSRVSVLICAPGDEIYSYFGHAAIRVTDPLYDRDIVFHYGAFSFEAPHFIWRFAKGETDYEIAVQRMSSFMKEFHDEKRKVVEYELLLTPAEKESLYEALVENYKPEHRVYRYSHFEDNCATRLRDQIEKAVGGKVKYDTSGDKPMSFRDMIDLYVQDNSWSGFGIKLALGLPTDQITSFSQKMFLPDYLGNDLSKAVVVREKVPSPSTGVDVPSLTGKFVVRDGVTSPLTASPVVIFDAPPFERTFSVTSPAVVVLLFFFAVLALTLLERKKMRRFDWLDVSVFLVFGLAGLILYFTTFISVMPSTKWNLNLIWACPLLFLLGILWMFPAMRPKLNWYIRMTSVILILFLLSMFFLPQTFHWLVVPLCLILLMRTGTMKSRILWPF